MKFLMGAGLGRLPINRFNAQAALLATLDAEALEES